MKPLNLTEFPPWMVNQQTQQGYKGSASNVIRGQRLVPTLNQGGPFPGSIFREEAQLIRAEDPSGKVNTWQVVLSPVFQFAIGPTIEGVPARHLAGDATGQYRVKMTWGGGGVSFQTEFNYPAAGASFSVAGDNIMLQAITDDFFTVFTEANKPCFDVWVTPAARPISPHPLTEIDFAGVIGGTIALFPWTRQAIITKSNPAATVLVEVSLGVVGTFVPLANMAAADQILTLPIPSRAIQLRVTPSVGNAVIMTDMVFT